MPKVAKAAMAVPFALFFVFSVALLPNLLRIEENDSFIRLNWSESLRGLSDYFRGFATGETFRFLSGRTELSFWDQIGGYFQVSLFYVAAGALIGMTIGLLAGIYFSLTRSEWLKRFVELTGAVPDFVSVLLLQFLIVFIASQTGIVVFQVASVSTDDPAIVLPLVSAVLIPANYMIRNVALQMKLALTENYIGFAKARGLSKTYIVFFHALPNVLPFIKADLHKLLGILMGNIFVVEYLYNLHGITMLIFTDAFAYEGYQYALVVNGLIALLVLYAIAYGLLRAYVWGWEKVFAR